VSDYSNSDDPKDHVPEVLKRKYVTFTGGYKETGLTNKYASFAAVDADGSAETDESGRKVIWLKYETSMPFTTCTTASPAYDDLTWYNFYTNKEDQYIVRYNSTSTSFNTTGTDGSRYARTSHFAFVGAFFEMKIVSLELTDYNSGTLHYLKLNDPVSGNITQDATGTAWDILYDDNSGDYSGCFRLREFTSTNNSTNHLAWKYGADNYPLAGTDDEEMATRLTVVDAPKKNYVYHIMRSDHSIAAKATISQEPSTKLDYAHIPEIICSPFLALTGVTLSFYASSEDATAGSSAITYAPDNATDATQDIWVCYNMGTALDSAPGTYITGGTSFNVRLNGQYIFIDETTIKSKADPTNDELGSTAYQWTLGGRDPYAMTINNSDNSKYVTIADGNSDGQPDWADGTISWSESAPASKFIIKGTSYTGAYEVMAATGDDVDAGGDTPIYYNIGRDAATDVTKMYSNATYQHDYEPLRFRLTPTGAKVVTYHLIDKADTDLLQITARHTTEEVPLFPDDYHSPLVTEYHYWSNRECTTPLATIGEATIVYVTYDVTDAFDLTNKKTMYLLRYEMGTPFRAEDGVDGLEASPITPIYPYCNGDCNFFVYGSEQYDIQQQSAASTRTRWAWFLESANADPYHVKICSRQTETYNGEEMRGYFSTFQPDDYNQIVTTLVWPNISGIQGTEYMILGTPGSYRLLTTNTVALDANHDGTPESTERRTVNSFEQYWKTFDTVKKKLLNDILEDKDKGNSKGEDADGSILVPTTPASYRELLTGTAEGQYGFHSYSKWAYAKRFNGYNKDGETKKGWEELEHWFQTVQMGEGYFNLIPVTIDPALILLDQHGWEIMRKPLPESATDPELEAKHAALRVYDSPMVEAYYFWTKASKRSGFHQYYNLSQQVTNGGEPYKSTSLGDLPDIDYSNVKDSKGNIYDQYVTYVVKDEYLKSCDVTLSYTDNITDPADNTKTYSKVTANVSGVPFLIQQGSHFASATDATTLKNDNVVPATGGMSQYIIDNAANFDVSTGSKKTDLWYLMPNLNIDNEMGFGVGTNPSHPWASDYDRKDGVKTSGFNSWAFDPYNIQISSVAHTSSYFVTNATKAEIDEGSIVGDGTTNTLGAQLAVQTTLTGGMDNRTLQMTNVTFMAVQDAEGNMQLMPRFDHSKRLKDFSTLVAPSDPGIADSYTKLYRPVVYNYQIIDNQGRESLRYQSGGDLVPQTPDHFKSPLAMNFKYYSSQTDANSDGVYDDEITESFASATLTDGKVYVRYEYNESTDDKQILQGKWFTMQLNGMDAKYDSGIKQGTRPVDGESNPLPIDASYKDWQWKFLETPQSDPDPYAVQLFNRDEKGIAQPATDTRYAILSHTSGDYALAQAGLLSYTYNFLNGSAMSTTTDASLAEDKEGENPSGFTSTTGTFHGTDSQVKLLDDVRHTFAYKVYTNGGVLAISEDQDHSTLEDNEFEPKLPENIQSPLLARDQYRYYNKDNFTFSEGNIATADTDGKALSRLYGLYDDEVIVRYTAYDPLRATYAVPNEKTNVDGHVARGTNSNDAALDLSNELLYNIIWYNDNMMTTSDDVDVVGHANQGIQTDSKHEWKIGGDDPYAITFYNKDAQKYITAASADNGAACTLTDSPTTFMLLPYEDFEYGVLSITGHENSKLTIADDSDPETKDAASITTGTPQHFIIFSLATHKVIYRLLIKNIAPDQNNKKSSTSYYIDIPYKEKKSDVAGTLSIYGSTMRDLTSTTTVTGDTYQLGNTVFGLNYCFDMGQVSLGDKVKVPAALERPNCKYFYYVEGIYDIIHNDLTGNDELTEDATLNPIYKGLEVKKMDNEENDPSGEGKIDKLGSDERLLGKTIRINVEYQFDDGLSTNTGSKFVLDPSEKKWYTFETNDATPYLAHYTYKDGELTGIAGRIGHYTNDFLWSPVGDPYGFKMYNRYVYKNGGETTKVMTTTSTPAATNNLIMNVDATTNPVYELLPGDTDGYFKVQTLTAKNGTPLYIDNNAGVLTLKTSTTTEWTYGLSDALLDPYYLGAGNVGGLTDDGKAAYKAVDTNPLYSTAGAKLMAKQAIVYDDANIVAFAPGYYRIFNQPNSKGITIPRYLSGYTHKTELTPGTGTNESPVAIPMHFYERENVNTSFEILGSGFTVSPATRGAIPIEDPEYDPASIFYISGSSPYTMQTQGLKVLGNKMTNSTGTSFYIDDIGGAVVVIHDGNADISSRYYLNYDQTDAAHIYDVKYTPNLGIADETKWCMEPANKQGLTLTVNSGGESEVYGTTYYYSTFYAPFDVQLPNDNGDKTYTAYTCVAADSPWPVTPPATTGYLHPKPLGTSGYNTGTHAGSSKFIPAGTPVLIATTDNAGVIKMTLPTSSPSSPISTIFTGQYLEQKLDAGNTVYSFGLPFTSTLTMDEESGDITGTLPTKATTGVGFYKNANPNKELELSKAGWTRNNRYVLHNKIYYRETGGGGGGARQNTRGVEFVPVVFDDDEDSPELFGIKEENRRVYDNRVYDLQGRCVATEEQVKDGTWRQNLRPGIYIINGRKIRL